MLSTARVPPVHAFESPKAVRIRLLSNETLRDVTLEAYGGLRVSSQRAWGKVSVSAKGNVVEVRDQKDLLIVVPFVNLASRSARWVDLQRPGKPAKRTVGWIQIRSKDGQLLIINVLPMETYVLGVVEGELGSVNFNVESLKAQIVASRSYLLAKRGRHRRDGYDFCDRPHCQVFSGTASIRPDFKSAMEGSRGEYLSYNGRPIPAFYHDNCGGRTAAIQDVWKSPTCPYLPSVEDGDEEMSYCRSAPRALWTHQANRDRLRECFVQEGWIRGYDALDTLRVIRINASERAHEVLVQTAHPRWIEANEFRRVINRFFGSEVLKSTYFTITRQKDVFTFTGRGWGHGVGMCQWGAIAMGNDGKTYREILSHYYPGTQLDRLEEPDYASNPHEHSASDN